MSKNNTKKWAIGTIFAAIAGFAAGILTAPKSGKETRKDIKDATLNSITEAEKQLKDLHAQLAELITEAQNKFGTVSATVKEQLEVALTAAKQAKTKAKVLLSTIHKGENRDQDLQKAINDATKALNHLKTFLKKSN
jgi:gas vesicle protein